MTGQTANLHETMIALEKADVSFQLMLQVRNKIVGAYEEIMRMQL
jgi:flagellar hook-basal body complex protein FliE